MPRPLSKKRRMLQVLTSHLAGITPDNGYDHDLDGKVFLGRPIFGNEQEVPFLSLLEAPRPNPVIPAGESDGKVRRSVVWDLALQGFVRDNKLDPTAPAYDLLAEVELRLSEIISEAGEGRQGGKHPAIFRLANLANDVQIGQGIVRPPAEKVSPTAFLYIPLTIKFTSDLSKPFVE